MSNFKALDKDSRPIEFAANGDGTSGSPHIPHHVVTESALPDGAATAAKQQDTNTMLQALQQAVADLNSAVGLLAKATDTQPVALSGGINLSLPVGLATQDTLENVRDRLPSALVAGRLLIDGSGVIQPVSGNVNVENFPVNQQISVATLPLPTGAATNITLTEIRDKLILSPATNSTLIEVRDRLPLDADVITESALTTVGSTPSRSMSNYSLLTYQATISGVGTNVVVRVEGSINGSSWFNLSPTNADTTITSNGTYGFSFGGKLSSTRFTLASFSGGLPNIFCFLLRGN